MQNFTYLVEKMWRKSVGRVGHFQLAKWVKLGLALTVARTPGCARLGHSQTAHTSLGAPPASVHWPCFPAHECLLPPASLAPEQIRLRRADSRQSWGRYLAPGPGRRRHAARRQR